MIKLFLLWLILLVISWPLAVLALIALPIVWLLSLPFRVLAAAVEGFVGLLTGLLLFPARLLRRAC